MKATTSVTEAKSELKKLIVDSQKVLAVIRGSSQGLADNVEAVAEGMSWRAAIWLKLTDDELKEVMSPYEDWFAGKDDKSVAFVNKDGEAKQWLGSDPEINDIDDAFLLVKG